MDGQEEHLHLIGTDAPRDRKVRVPRDGKASRSHSRTHQHRRRGFRRTGKTERDKGDRLYSYVWIKIDERWELLNDVLLREGLAGYEKPTKGNTRYDDDLQKAAETAKKSKLGYYATCTGKLHNDDKEYRCLKVKDDWVALIESGVRPETDATIRRARAVRAPGFEISGLLPADLQGPGLAGSDNIAVWTTESFREPTSETLMSVLEVNSGKSLAFDYSNWPPQRYEIKPLHEAKDCVKRAFDKD